MINMSNYPFKSLQTFWWRHVAGPRRAAQFSCAARQLKLTSCRTEPGHREAEHVSLVQWGQTCNRWRPPVLLLPELSQSLCCTHLSDSGSWPSAAASRWRSLGFSRPFPHASDGSGYTAWGTVQILLVCRTDCEIIPMNQIFNYSVYIPWYCRNEQ